MGTAPPPAWGMISTAPPRKNGGNLDNKELVAGTTLYLPIFVPGALFSAGDGHGVQGDGEVCVTAVETGLTGTFRLTVRDDMRLECSISFARAPGSTAIRPTRWRASPPTCASRRWSTATRAST